MGVVLYLYKKPLTASKIVGDFSKSYMKSTLQFIMFFVYYFFEIESGFGSSLKPPIKTTACKSDKATTVVLLLIFCWSILIAFLLA